MVTVRAMLTLMALTFLSCVALAQDENGLRALLIEYRCPLVDRLERLYEAGDPASDQDQFIAVTVPEHLHGYVQCMSHDKRTKVLCEASSDFYFDPPGLRRTFYLAEDAVAALGRLGFSTDGSQGNFRIDLDVAEKPDFNAISDFMLKALHDGYGARAQSKLKFNAPLAPLPNSKCVPAS